MQEVREDVSIGFAPVAAAGATVLILGSLPGKRSLDALQYYAHPRNAFWRIMQSLFGVEGNYAERCEQLTTNGIALWDVLRSSVRSGSLDANIRMRSAQTNDFTRFFTDYPGIRRVCFNGRKAEAVYRKLVMPGLSDPVPEMSGLPSTSPAHASLSFEDKLEAWRRVLIQ